MISECSKLAQKEYKGRHNWVGKVIHWEMYKKFKFDHTNKWYMHNRAPVLENDTPKLQWDFNIQTDHLIPARRPDLIIINKIKLKKLRNMKVMIVPITIWAQLLKGLEDLEVGGRLETIQTTALLRTARILR